MVSRRAVLGSMASALLEEAAPAKPNFLFILADDETESLAGFN